MLIQNRGHLLWKGEQSHRLQLVHLYMDVSENRVFFPNHPFSIVFSIYKPSILGAHPYFWTHLFFVTKQNIRPRKLTWNLKMKPWNRRFLLKTIIFRFHVSFRQTWVPSQCQSVYPRTWTKTFKTKEQTQPGRHVTCWAMVIVSRRLGWVSFHTRRSLTNPKNEPNTHHFRGNGKTNIWECTPHICLIWS